MIIEIDFLPAQPRHTFSCKNLQQKETMKISTATKQTSKLIASTTETDQVSMVIVVPDKI